MSKQPLLCTTCGHELCPDCVTLALSQPVPVSKKFTGHKVWPPPSKSHEVLGGFTPQAFLTTEDAAKMQTKLKELGDHYASKQKLSLHTPECALFSHVPNATCNCASGQSQGQQVTP